MNRSILLAVIASAILLAGCGKLDPTIYAQNGPVADGDMLVEASIGDARHLTPPLVDEVGGADIDGLVFDGLLRYNDKLELEPCLAEKWRVSKNGQVITYYLRKGVKFHDGVEFTANDVLFTYKVYSDPGTNTPAGADYQDIKDVAIIDPYTVQVTYKKPFAPALSATFTSILPKHLLEGKDINKDDFDRHPVGTGPYRFVEWKTAQQIVLEANPDYWGGKPHVKRFIMKIIPDQSTQFLDLLKGDIDSIGAWLHGALTPEQYAKQLDTPRFKDYYNASKYDALEYTYIGWNLKNPLFQDKKVRQALTMAIDRQSIIQNVVYGLGSVATGPYALHSWANNPRIQPWPFDPQKAQQYLKAAGWKLGQDGLLHKVINHKDTPFKFTLMTNHGNVSRERVATIVQQQLKQVGIEVDVQVMEWTTFLSQYIHPRKFDAVILGWTVGFDPDCYSVWHSSQTGQHQFNFVGYQNKVVDMLLIEGRRTLDQKKRAKIYQRLHSILNDDQPYTFLYVPDQLMAVHKRFKGYTVTENGIFTHPEQWYVPVNQQKYKP